MMTAGVESVTKVKSGTFEIKWKTVCYIDACVPHHCNEYSISALIEIKERRDDVDLLD